MERLGCPITSIKLATTKPNRPALLFLGLMAASLTALLLLPPITQDQSYHRFADQRAFFGVPNFWNVVSNLPFIAVGVVGLRQFHRDPATRELMHDRRKIEYLAKALLERRTISGRNVDRLLRQVTSPQELQQRRRISRVRREARREFWRLATTGQLPRISIPPLIQD
jgi:hypothetical protein